MRRREREEGIGRYKRVTKEGGQEGGRRGRRGRRDDVWEERGKSKGMRGEN